jgi:general secretion pathway protein G
MIRTLPRSVHACRRPGAGFTLIEVMVVVAILAILASVVVLQVMDRPGEARQAAAQADIKTIVNALNLYRLDNYAYPSSEQGLAALVAQPSGEPEARNWRAGGYLDRVPVDPWQREYLYLNPGQRGAFDVYTLGADGRPGGEGENADVGNWSD